MPRVFALLLTVIGPFLVFGGFYQVLITWKDWQDVNAARNAGRILNNQVIDQGVVAAMEVLLEQQQPEVLIIGPSYANTDVEPERVAARLGLPEDKVVLFAVPMSVGPHWYAILKNRVYANGHAPKLVVVVSGMQSMLLNTPLTDDAFVNLGVQLSDEPDPEILARVKRSNDLRLAHLREQRGKVREAMFDALRFQLATKLVRTPAGRRVTKGEVRASLARVFDDAQVDMSLHAASMPIVEANRLDDRAYTPDMLPAPEASFIPVITDLVESHGGRTVWVRPPMSPHIPDHLDDVVLPGVQEKTLEILAPKAGDFLDMRALPMTAAMFRNEDHMNEEGSRRFSEALADSLKELDALAPKPRPELAAPAKVEGWVEEADGGRRDLPGGDATVAVGAGESLGLTVEGWDPMRGPFAVHALIETPDGAPAPLASFGGQRLVVRRAETIDDLVRWEVHERRHWVDGVHQLRLAAPAIEGGVPGGAMVRAAAFGVGRGRVFPVGTAAALDGHRAELFGVPNAAGGTFDDATVRPLFARKPSRVPGHDRPVTDLPRTLVGAFETERWSFLSDEALIGETNFGSRCSPLRITEDGTQLPEANVPCTEVQRKKGGRSCHTPQRIFFSASDRTDPATNGRAYRLVLDEERLCDGSVFLYPKDAFEVRFPPDRLAGFAKGARYFTLGANYLNERKAKLRVVLTVDGEVAIDELVGATELDQKPRTWQLPAPVRAGADVSLTLRNQASVFYLVTEATLSERAP